VNEEKYRWAKEQQGKSIVGMPGLSIVPGKKNALIQNIG
jgi:hypothetical protein